MKTDSALSYFGADGAVARPLAAMLDHCSHVTIPMCGGMSILPWLKARAIVANDLNNAAINFYRHASGAYGHVARDDLFDRCQTTLSHPYELTSAARVLLAWSEHMAQPGDAAWAYWAQCWIGRKGRGGTTGEGDGMPSVRWTASGGTNASRIRAAADDLPAWAKHFERCEWLCEDFRILMPKMADQDGCGGYIDAPWRKLGDNYRFPFVDQDHIDLEQQAVRFVNTTIVIRYGDDQFIRELYKDWFIIEASSRTQSNAVKGEIWITNRIP